MMLEPEDIHADQEAIAREIDLQELAREEEELERLCGENPEGDD